MGGQGTKWRRKTAKRYRQTIDRRTTTYSERERSLINGGCKNGTDIVFLHAKFGGDPPLHGGVRNKSWVFLFLPVRQPPVLQLFSRRF